MTVFEPIISDNYQFYEADSLEHLEMLQEKDYRYINSIHFSLAKVNRDKLGDITIIDNSMLLAFSERATNIFKSAGKFLNLQDTDDYSLLDAPIINALDYEKSIIDYFAGTQQLKRIRKYFFNTQVIKEIDAFTLPIQGSPVFVTDTFVEKYKVNGYNGLDFYIVFSE